MYLKSFAISGIRVFVVSFFLFSCHHALAGDLSEGERDRIIADFSNAWKKYAGDIDFSGKFLFQRMLYLKPQPVEKFRKFENLQLSRSVALMHEMWLRRHFKGGLLKKLQNLRPSSYFLREGKYDESLLLYQTHFAGAEICLLENYTASLITFTPDGYDIAKGLNKEYLKQILSDWLNLDDHTDSLEKLLRHQVYGRGIIFANKTGDSHVLPMTGWQDDITCFLTERGVSFLLFKVSPERAGMNIPADPGWLDKGKGLLDMGTANKQ